MRAYFLIITLLLIINNMFAQDTLYFENGDYKVVELISINENDRLIYYKSEGKIEVRSINSLKSYSNHTKLENNNSQLKYSTNEPYRNNKNNFKYSLKDPSKYAYNKISFGINLLSPLFFNEKPFRRVISSNYNQSIFFQYNFNNHIGVRLPLRIGFGPKISTNYYYYYNWKPNLIFEYGGEICFMKDDNQKVTSYFLPGIYFGKYNINYFDYSLMKDLTVQSSYFRIAINKGFQFNFSKYFQFNTEMGINYMNRNIYKFSFQLSLNLVYRLGGKLRP